MQEGDNEGMEGQEVEEVDDEEAVEGAAEASLVSPSSCVQLTRPPPPRSLPTKAAAGIRRVYARENKRPLVAPSAWAASVLLETCPPDGLS